MKFKTALLVSSILVGTAPAMAQVSDAGKASAVAAPSDQGLDDIVVTAQKRSENMQNVPIAVSAVTSSQLTKSGVHEVVDIKLAVPTLNIVNYNGNATASLRGVGSVAIGPGIENPVAIYVDGVYYASPKTALVSLNNVEQVEVLKGPQGTLFGRNATGGLIQVSTRTPSSTLGAEFNLSYGNYDTVTANAYVTGGIGDVIAGDIAVGYAHQNKGWGRNLTTGDDVGQIDHDFAIRSKWVITPGAGTKFTLIGDASDNRGTTNTLVTLPGTVNGYDPSRGPEPDHGYDGIGGYTDNTDAHGWGLSLRWDQEIGDLNFSSISAYRHNAGDENFDYDTIENSYQQILARVNEKQFSQELQLQSKPVGPLTWVVGAYYFNAMSGYSSFNLIEKIAGDIVTINADQKTRSIAGYGQATYALSDQTNLTLGGRYTFEKRQSVDGHIDVYVIPLDLALPTVTPPERSEAFRKFTFRAALDHRFSSEVLAYASFNRGFKSGGFNTGNPGTNPFKPEQLDAYEVGLKTDLLDRHLRINASGFYYDYKNLQVQRLEAGTVAVYNGPAAEIYGIDVDMQAAITDRFSLSGGVGWTHSNFKQFTPCLATASVPGTPSVVNGDCSGNQLPLASKLLANLTADYTFDLAGGTLNANGNLYYNHGFHFEADNFIRQPSYINLGAMLKWTSAGSNLSLSVYGKNLTNKRVLSLVSTIANNGTHLGYYAAPRTYGVTLGYKY